MARMPSSIFLSGMFSCLESQAFRSGAYLGSSPLYVMIWLSLEASAWNVFSGSRNMNDSVWACVARFWKSSHCLQRRTSGGPCVCGLICGGCAFSVCVCCVICVAKVG